MTTPASDAPLQTGILYDPIFLRHQTGLHPESPDRLHWIIAHLEAVGLWDRCAHPDCRDALADEIALVHNPDYIRQIRRTAETGGGYLTIDTVMSTDSYAAAVRAAGAGLTAVEAVVNGSLRNAFCLVRPPGHHALPDRAMGFCLFNNIAVAAAFLRQQLGVDRVAIFDWDGHHGNGTQHAFYRDASVFYASLHSFPNYPGTGYPQETGADAGAKTTVNRPLPHDLGPQKYLAVAREVIEGPMADFRPAFILISAGFDACRGDPFASLGLEPGTFHCLTRALTALADSCCRGRVVSFLEGGYHQDMLPRCVEQHLRAFLEPGAAL